MSLRLMRNYKDLCAHFQSINCVTDIVNIKDLYSIFYRTQFPTTNPTLKRNAKSETYMKISQLKKYVNYLVLKHRGLPRSTFSFTCEK